MQANELEVGHDHSELLQADHDASAEGQENELEIAVNTESEQNEVFDHSENLEDSDEEAGSRELDDSDFVPEGDEA